jgi:3-phosphoshikimate 1-carboxyvinyltransferase
MGAEVVLTSQNTVPARIAARESGLRPIHYTMPVASAQIKSALLLAGLGASGPVEIKDPGISRDHSERMMSYLGIPVVTKGHCVQLTPVHGFKAKPLEIVGDISSAAFFMVAASIVPGSDIRLRNVGVNPTRTGVIDLLRRMGADLVLYEERLSAGGEPVADIRVRHATLKGIDIGVDDVPRAIDELPILLVAAACSTGQTHLSGAAELRVKESDRLKAMALGLKAMGVTLMETSDGMIIEGGCLKGASIDSCGDHRIAMAFAIAASVAVGETIVQDVAQIQTSFPSFKASARELGLPIQETSVD